MAPSHTAGGVLARCAGLAAGALLALGAAPEPVRAQEADTAAAAPARVGSFEVAAVVGYQWYDKASALRNAPSVGIRIVNPRIVPSLPGISLGFSGNVARPTTRGEYFPWNRQIYYSDINRRNDTTLVFEVSQRVTMATYGAELGWRMGGGGLGSIPGFSAASFELSAGIGGYSFWLDPEQNRRNEIKSGLSFSFGGGFGVPLPGNSTLRLRLDDVVLTNFNRDWFSLHDPLFREELFPNPVTAPPAAKNIVHNLRLTAQFAFLPGAVR